MCIIHDKVDSAKTTNPRMQVTTKLTPSLGQFPVNVTRMVTHGHGDGAYAYYLIDLWPGDSNFIISSLARLLRNNLFDLVEIYFLIYLHTHFLRYLCEASHILPKVLSTNPTRRLPLPKHLYLQLDNSAKDNKNEFLMAFLSMLTNCGVFKQIQVGFLLVGHTHKDIDAYFSHLSRNLKNQNSFVVANLMKAFMESQELSFMPKLYKK